MSDERTLLRAASERLAATGIGNPRLDVRVLWQAAQGDEARFKTFIVRRAAREPVAYITGHREFWSLDFLVEPGILIPRPDTETLVEAVLEEFPDRILPLSVVDFGTGSGCILAAILHEYPNARGIGVDQSPVALKVASENLVRLGLSGRAEIRSSNWAENLSAHPHFDVIVSNPPYIPSADIAGLEPDVQNYEPLSALDGGPDGLDDVRLLAPVMRRLNGKVFLEIGIGQAEAAAEIMAASGLTICRVAQDLAGVPRIVIADSEDLDEKSVGMNGRTG